MKKTIETGRHTFEIVNEVPVGYGVWNIPSDGIEEFLPLINLETSKDHNVDTTTLKAIKVTNGIDEIKEAASWGIRNTEQAHKIINRKQSNKFKLSHATVALPFMEEVNGL